MKISSVLGFAFNQEKTRVLLINKKKPDWQNGLLNGIGGKIEDYDSTPYHAMTREFIEECGLKTVKEDWYLFAKMESSSFECYCFVGFFEDSFLEDYETLTSEEVSILNLEELFSNKFEGCISNLQWLISLCIDKHLHKVFIEAKYSE